MRRTGLVHGTRSAYTNYACRCTACRAANAQAAQRFRDLAAAGLKSPVPHGTRGAYSNYGCRCDLCRVAHTGNQLGVRP